MDQQSESIEERWFQSVPSRQELVELYPLLYLQVPGSPSNGVVAREIFVRSLNYHLADSSSWQEVFGKIEELESSGVDAGEIIQGNREQFGAALAILWNSFPECRSREELDQLQQVINWVNDPFLRVQLQSFYYERLWEGQVFEEKLDAMLSPVASGLVDLRRFNQLIEEEANTESELHLAQRRLRERFDQLLSSETREMGVAVLLDHVRPEPSRRLSALASLLKTSQSNAELRLFLYNTMTEFDTDSWMDDETMIHYANQRIKAAESLEQKMFRMDDSAKYFLLRKLLTGKYGLISDPVFRVSFLDDLLEGLVTSGQQRNFMKLIWEIVNGLGEMPTWKPFYFALNPILAKRLAIPPPALSDWRDILSDQHLQLGDPSAVQYLRSSMARGIAYFKNSDPRYRLQPWKHPEEFLYHSEELLRSQLLNREITTLNADATAQLSPLEFIVEVAQHFGALGVRFLQLLPQFVDLPQESQSAFSKVYDAVVGQSKLAALAVLEREWPQLWDHISRLEKRVGGAR